MSIFNLIVGQLDRVAFSIGSWSVYWYGIILGIAILVGYLVFSQEGKRKGIDSDTSFDLLFWTVVIGFIGARLYYVLFSLDQYLTNPIKIFFIWEGGLAIYGGVLGGLLAIYYLTRQYHLDVVKVLDIAAPALMIAQSIGRWGNFMNQEAHGGPVSRSFLESLQLPDFIIEQMNIQGTYYHPTFLYESLWNLIGFVLIIFLRSREKLLKKGEVLAFYMAWYGAGRLWIEGLRTDSLYLGPIRISQLVSLVLIILAIATFIRIRKNPSIAYYTDDRQSIESLKKG